MVTGALSGLHGHLVVGLKDLDLEAETETGVEMESGVRNASVEVE